MIDALLLLIGSTLWAIVCAFVAGYVRANYFELRAVRERQEGRRVLKVVR